MIQISNKKENRTKELINIKQNKHKNKHMMTLNQYYSQIQDQYLQIEVRHNVKIGLIKNEKLIKKQK